VKVARRWAASFAVLAMAAAAGCGKKGPPLAPFVLLPAAPARVAAQRAGDDVYVTLTLPAQNVDASKPADVRRVEVYAFSATTPPPRVRALELATLIATVPVAAALPEGALAGVKPRTAVVKDAAPPGATITVREALGPDAFVPKTLPAPPVRTSPGAAAQTRPERPGPLRRFYIAVAYSDRGRPGPQSAPVELPLTAVPDTPSDLEIAYSIDSIVVSWQPAGGLLGFLLDNQLPLDEIPGEEGSVAGLPELPPGPTRYNVYRELAPDPMLLPPPTAAVAPGAVVMPRPLTPSPIDALTFADSVEFERTRCYWIRAVRGMGEGAVESAATEPRCVTPVDVFAPEPPSGLSAVVSEGAISLIWESSPDLDVWGYVVLRGAPGDATLLPLNDAPVIETQFTDRSVVPGTRYVYAVVALDSRLPVPNASAESARIEESAR
jgi:hypothetical protein